VCYDPQNREQKVKPMIPEADIYSTIGNDGFIRIVSGFYRRVAEDDLIGPMYPADDLPGSEQRLRSFLIFRLGGPPTYLEQRGHPKLKARHMPFLIDQAARDRWVNLMTAALAEAELEQDAAATLQEFFEKTATFLINRLAV
jgi:hemoglobin